ncbi:dipeptidase [Pseudacidobacterium ailaaui]|jgi:membrane dipeptidase|uniref:dipeptidase n=1 Tax=Pseudacidobacterium ailaaui TaxID=1382359 RepID=UPI0005D2675D|nr:dipeptidase [Pseudacidobacterium ailaaui]MBX6358614.1 dipeptidase [Pseudacidobacterium ailaaui]
MRQNSLAALLLTVLPLAAQTTAQKNGAGPSVNPLAVHRNAIVIDTHADTTQRLLDENYDLDGPLRGGNLNFESAKEGNLGAEFFSIWVEPDLYKGHYARRTLELIDAVYQQAAKHPDKMRMAFTADDILAAHREHKLAALMGIEGGHSIEDSLALLRDYYRLGVRYMTLTWSNSNGWADSSGDINNPAVNHTQDGLTDFGKDVVYEMNRLGMMVDISHVADKTFYRAVITSRAPVIASHSSARALCNAPRNMTDDMLRAVARSGGPDSKGGVVMVNYYAAFISQKYRDAMLAMEPEIAKAKEALKEQYAKEGKQVTYGELDKLEQQYLDRIPRPPLSDLIDHIDHIAKVAGIDHVGLGSDFDGVSNQLPEGINSAADLPKITQALMARGYSAADCDKILGGNLLRVMREVEATAKRLQSEPDIRPRISEQQPFKK